MSKVFQINRDLLNPRFESYKIISDENEDEKRSGVLEESFALPGKVLGSGIESIQKSILGYKEIQDRSRIKYLVSNKNQNQAAYIDENGFIILICFNANDGEPLFRPIRKIQTNLQHSIELPGLVSINDDSWLISDGLGNLTLLKTQQSGSILSGSVVNIWEWKKEGKLVPFRIVACSYGTKEISILLQRTCKSSTSSTNQPGIGANASSSFSSKKRETTKTSFELAIAMINLIELAEKEKEWKPTELTIQSTFEIEESPYFTAFSESNKIILFSESVPSSNTKVVATDHDAKNDLQEDTNTLKPTRIPPYAWTQTSESVTVAIKLPEHIKKGQIQCHFSETHLQLTLKNQSASIHEIDEDGEHSNDLALDCLIQGKFKDKQFWADVDAEGSVWTWEMISSDEFNLLTLHLEKKHIGTRWPQLFKEKAMKPFLQSDGMENETGLDDDALDEVPETIDPSEMLNILNGMEKYTSNANRSEGLGSSVLNQGTSLLQDGLEEEDAEVGQHCVLSILDIDGSVKVLEKDVIILATPTNNTNGLECITIRNDLDGLVFVPKQDETFFHFDSLPALSYVLASKRDCKRVYNILNKDHDKSKTTILAFDSITGAQGQGGAGNLFVYYSPFDSTKQQNYGRSRVIRLGSGVSGNRGNEEGANVRSPSGPLIDVGVMNNLAKGERKVMVLCQERLLILHNVL